MASTKKMDLVKAAKESLTLSPLMNGRDKLETNDILGLELTIKEFDFVNFEKEDTVVQYPIFVFEEYPNAFYAGGIVLKKLAESLSETISAITGGLEDGETYTIPDGYEAVKIKLTMGQSKSTKRPLVTATIL